MQASQLTLKQNDLKFHHNLVLMKFRKYTRFRTHTFHSDFNDHTAPLYGNFPQTLKYVMEMDIHSVSKTLILISRSVE